ncbi:MAG: flagellar motor switch protein FliG [Pseudomonadota bacterium]|jgi:flagellar motor switch protein FliG
MDRELTNPEKAALTLLSLGKEAAAQIMQNLTEDEVKAISRAFLTVSEVDRETQLITSKDFLRMLSGSDKLLIDGREFAASVISSAFGQDKSAGLLEYVNGTRKQPIGKIIGGVPEKLLLGFISAEHPQTIAFLMTVMNPDQAALVLKQMQPEMQTDVLIRISNISNVKADVVDEVREVLQVQLCGDGTDDEDIGGPKSAADILNFIDRSSEERIIAEIEETFPDLAETIRNLMFTFEDIKKIDDRGVQTVLKDVPREQLVLALRTASAELKDIVYRNVSQRAAEMIKEDLEAMGPTKLKDVEKAQQGIVDVVRKLEEEGKVVISGGGGGDQLV